MEKLLASSDNWLQLGLGGGALFILLVVILLMFYVIKQILANISSIAVALTKLTKSISDFTNKTDTHNTLSLDNSTEIKQSIVRIHSRIDSISADMEVVRDRQDYNSRLLLKTVEKANKK